MGNKFPMCNWNQNEYADWLLTNSASLNVQAMTGVIQGVVATGQIIGGIAIAGLGKSFTGAMGLGMATAGLNNVAGAYSNIVGAMATNTDHSKIPNSTQGLASGGDINFADNRSGFYFYHYSIKKEFAKIIDDYFSMFGYRVNSLEVPNLTSRRNWNFLKIIDPNVEGDIVPEKDMNKYKEQLKQGITFWHDPTTFRDYSQSNGNS